MFNRNFGASKPPTFHILSVNGHGRTTQNEQIHNDNKMDDFISITLGTPKYGWLPVAFRYKDFQINFDASNVLNDPIDELTYVTTQLRDKETKRITWWLEAPAYFFDITKNDNNFSLTIFYSDDLLDNVTKPKLLMRIKGSKDEIIEPLRLALKHFETLTYEKQHWYGDYDEEE